MFYTNGRILIHDGNDGDVLSKTVKKIEEYIQEDKGTKVEFKFDKASDFPAYEVPTTVSYHDIVAILGPNVSLKAINEDIIALPEKKTVSVKYYFDEYDKDKMAQEISNHVIEKHRLEEQKAQISKEYGQKITSLEQQIFLLSSKHQTGYEFRQKETIVKLNFADKRKYFVDAHSPEIVVTSEPLEPQEFQIQINHTIEERYNPEMIIKDAEDDTIVDFQETTEGNESETDDDDFLS